MNRKNYKKIITCPVCGHMDALGIYISKKKFKTAKGISLTRNELICQNCGVALEFKKQPLLLACIIFLMIIAMGVAVSFPAYLSHVFFAMAFFSFVITLGRKMGLLKDGIELFKKPEKPGSE